MRAIMGLVSRKVRFLVILSIVSMFKIGLSGSWCFAASGIKGPRVEEVMGEDLVRTERSLTIPRIKEPGAEQQHQYATWDDLRRQQAEINQKTNQQICQLVKMLWGPRVEEVPGEGMRGSPAKEPDQTKSVAGGERAPAVKVDIDARLGKLSPVFKELVNEVKTLIENVEKKIDLEEEIKKLQEELKGKRAGEDGIAEKAKLEAGLREQEIKIKNIKRDILVGIARLSIPRKEKEKLIAGTADTVSLGKLIEEIVKKQREVAILKGKLEKIDGQIAAGKEGTSDVVQAEVAKKDLDGKLKTAKEEVEKFEKYLEVRLAGIVESVEPKEVVDLSYAARIRVEEAKRTKAEEKVIKAEIETEKGKLKNVEQELKDLENHPETTKDEKEDKEKKISELTREKELIEECLEEKELDLEVKRQAKELAEESAEKARSKERLARLSVKEQDIREMIDAEKKISSGETEEERKARGERAGAITANAQEVKRFKVLVKEHEKLETELKSKEKEKDLKDTEAEKEEIEKEISDLKAKQTKTRYKLKAVGDDIVTKEMEKVKVAIDKERKAVTEAKRLEGLRIQRYTEKKTVVKKDMKAKKDKLEELKAKALALAEAEKAAGEVDVAGATSIVNVLFITLEAKPAREAEEKRKAAKAAKEAAEKAVNEMNLEIVSLRIRIGEIEEELKEAYDRQTARDQRIKELDSEEKEIDEIKEEVKLKLYEIGGRGLDDPDLSESKLREEEK
ncbi:MAG: hypothetical protein LBU29_00265, partial [Endomicrobium sp.]|nr:hypothetical protein [Endomicrobium sp.]